MQPWALTPRQCNKETLHPIRISTEQQRTVGNNSRHREMRWHRLVNLRWNLLSSSSSVMCHRLLMLETLYVCRSPASAAHTDATLLHKAAGRHSRTQHRRASQPRHALARPSGRQLASPLSLHHHQHSRQGTELCSSDRAQYLPLLRERGLSRMRVVAIVRAVVNR